jgi:NDP-sugar pyrophosphorylase family protein
MKLIIPMSGHGSRFKAAGYSDLKPLIVVDGKPIIAHVLDMFPGEEDVVFICNEDHLGDVTMGLRELLHTLKPTSKIVSIPNHRQGPVYALTYAFDLIADEEDIMVSYCDFTQRWDYEQFKRDLEDKKPAGAIPSYTGFHPHLLHKNLYAGILADQEGMLVDIQEKHCFTENPENSYHSGGAYYFASGELLKKYSHELIEADMHLNGEYYVSMLYYLLRRDNLPVYIPTVTHFMQWGTPDDLEEYEAWSEKIHTDIGKPKPRTAIPGGRRGTVTIPHPEDSPEYKKSYQYWLACLGQP